MIKGVAGSRQEPPLICLLASLRPPGAGRDGRAAGTVRPAQREQRRPVPVPAARAPYRQRGPGHRVLADVRMHRLVPAETAKPGRKHPIMIFF